MRGPQNVAMDTGLDSCGFACFSGVIYLNAWYFKCGREVGNPSRSVSSSNSGLT